MKDENSIRKLMRVYLKKFKNIRNENRASSF